MAQVLALGSDCFTCLKYSGERHRMVILPNGCYFCEICKTVRPSKAMQGRAGIADNLKIAGFFLLLLSTFLMSRLPLISNNEIIYLGFLAAYAFYFISIAQSVRVDIHVRRL